MNDVKPIAKPRRAAFLILSGLLATLFVLASVQWMAADDNPPPTPEPENNSPYADRVLSEDELLQLDSALERYTAAHIITGDQLFGSDISASKKVVDREEVPVGSEIQFTIMISNSGDAQFTGIMTDSLPTELTFVSHEVGDMVGGISNPGFTVDGNVVTWGGVIVGGGYANLIITARVNDGVEADTIVNNTAEIRDISGEQTVFPSVAFKVLEKTGGNSIFPFITFGIQPDPPKITNFSATRPNSENRFSLSWSGGPRASKYVIEMDDNPEFSSPDILEPGLVTSMDFNPEPSFRNVMYFRVRAFEGFVPGEWSETVRVVGAYFDDFFDPTSGWGRYDLPRRTTHIDDVNTWYDIEHTGDDWFILQVHNRFDWGLASPLMPAPELPYVIEFEAQQAHVANLVTTGAVFGGDLPGGDCPDTSTEEGWYQHELCFNHFYHTNTMFDSGRLRMRFERVDSLEWIWGHAPPMKRIVGYSKDIFPMKGVETDSWNYFRIEVRANEIRVFAGKRGETLYHVTTNNETQWVNDPYFGVLATTSEYNNSTMRVDYYAVTPLDE